MSERVFFFIQQRLKTSFSRQKSYADPKGNDVSFSAGDLIFFESVSYEGSNEVWKERKASSKVH